MHRRHINILLVPFLAMATVFVLWLLLQPPQVLTDASQQTLSSIARITPDVQTATVMALAPQYLASHKAAIVITKTVGLDPHTCAMEKSITVTAGTEVVYCYQIRNTGDITLTTHTVVDNKIENPLLDREVITLSPGIETSSQADFTAAVRIDATSINTVTWIATNGSVTATATDTAAVLVPSIVVTYTVGRDPHHCGSDVVNVPYGASVVHCYHVHNDGIVPLRLHDALDSQLGAVVKDWPYLLQPGTSVLVTATSIVTETTTDIVTWTASLSEAIYALDIDNATVRVPAIRAKTTVGLDSSQCATTDEISATIGTEVFYCYLITNTGGVPLIDYEVQDLLFDQTPITFTHNLTGNTSLFFTMTVPVTATQINTVTWLVNTTEGYTTTSRDSARVNALSQLEVEVFYDVDQRNGRNDGEPTVPTVTMQLDTPTSERLIARTNTAGIATFMGLANGVYTASISGADLPAGYMLPPAAVNQQTLTLTAPAIYTAVLPIFTPPGADSDGDGLPDLTEGSRDSDGDGIPDYQDTTQMLYLSLIDR